MSRATTDLMLGPQVMWQARVALGRGVMQECEVELSSQSAKENDKATKRIAKHARMYSNRRSWS